MNPKEIDAVATSIAAEAIEDALSDDNVTIDELSDEVHSITWDKLGRMSVEDHCDLIDAFDWEADVQSGDYPDVTDAEDLLVSVFAERVADGYQFSKVVRSVAEYALSSTALDKIEQLTQTDD